MIKVSVIVPVYNAQNYIEKCLESVLNQTLQKIEIIVVNDGSTDNTLQIVTDISKRDERIFIIDKENGGVSTARNEGLKVAKGKYIQFLDSDDWLEKNCCKSLYEISEENNFDMVISDIFVDYGNDTSYILNDLGDNTTYTNIDYLVELFKGNSYPSVLNKFCKKSLYDNIEFPEGISLGEDLYVTVCLALKAKNIYKQMGYYLHYIQNPKSLTRNNISLKIYQLFEAFTLIEAKLKEMKSPQGINDLFNEYKLLQAINFITSVPHKSHINYEKGFDDVYLLIKNSHGIPDNLPLSKKIIYRILIMFPYKFMLSFLIDIIDMIKKIRIR